MCGVGVGGRELHKDMYDNDTMLWNTLNNPHMNIMIIMARQETVMIIQRGSGQQTVGCGFTVELNTTKPRVEC